MIWYEVMEWHTWPWLCHSWGGYLLVSHCGVKKKVKCTVVQALRLCTGCMAHRGSRGIALPSLEHGTRRGWGVSVTPRLLFTPGKDLVPIVQEAGWATGPVWTGSENLAPAGIWSPAVQPIASRYTDYTTRPTHCGGLGSIPRQFMWDLWGGW